MSDPTTELLAIRSVRRAMSLKLAMWSGGSMLMGLALWLICGLLLQAGTGRSILEAVGAECVIWGLLDAGFALIGLQQAQAAARSAPTDPSAGQRERGDRDRLERLLRFNVHVLNLIFMVFGAVLLITGLAMSRGALTGHGVGVLVQITFLSLFDRAYLRSLRLSHAASG